ncbi:MAG: phage/plasmid primase, P4 family [Promethearchaeota archaeon]
MLHQNSGSPAFVTDGTVWFCHHQGCKKGGGIVEYYMHTEGLNKWEAVKRVAERFNLTIHEELTKREIEMKTQVEQSFKDFAEQCHRALKQTPFYDDVKQRRNFTDDTMERFKIGLLIDEVKAFMEQRYSWDVLIEAGFMHVAKEWKRFFDGDVEITQVPRWKSGKRIVYPYLNRNGDPIYFIYRVIDSEPDWEHFPWLNSQTDTIPKYLKQIVQDRRFVSNQIFGLNSLTRERNILIIAEGITDAISVIQAGFQCLSPVTTKINKNGIDMMINHCKRYDKVVIIFDNEESGGGLKGATRILKQFVPAGINAYIGIIPRPENVNKIDLDEYLRNGQTIEEQAHLLQQLCDDAIEGVDYFIRQLNHTSTTKQIKEVLKMINNDDVAKRYRTMIRVKHETGLTIEAIREIYQQVMKAEKKYNAHDIALRIIRKHPMAICPELKNNFLLYQNGVYKLESKDKLDALIRDYFVKKGLNEQLTDAMQMSKIKNIKGYIAKESMESIHEFNTDHDIVNVKNGLLDISDLNDIKLLPHDPSHKSTIQLPVAYNPKVKPTVLYDFVVQVVGMENIDNFFEGLGDTLLKDPSRYRKVHLLIGLSGTGKSTLLDIVEFHFLGSENVSNVSIQELHEDEYAVADLFGKIANMYRDLPKRALKEVDKFKIAIGDSALKGNEKWGRRFKFKNTAKWWVAANQLPESSEQSEAFYDRFNIIVCRNQVPKSERDPMLLQKIVSDEELSGLLNLALDGLRRLVERGRYDPQYSDDVEKTYKTYSNPVMRFIELYCTVEEYEGNDENYEIDKDLLLSCVNEFEERLGVAKTPNKTKLTQRINQTGYPIATRTFQREGVRHHVYTHIKFNDTARNELQALRRHYSSDDSNVETEQS